MTVAVGLGVGVSNALPWFEVTRSWVPIEGMTYMRCNTALGLIGAALALAARQWIRRGIWWSTLTVLLASVPTLIGGLTSLQYLGGVNLGIDTLFAAATFPGDVANTYVTHPGRMSLNASLSLLFLGLGLLNVDRQVPVGGAVLELGPLLAIAAALPAFCAVVGHWLGVGGFTGILRSTNILYHAALALLALSFGAVACRPHSAAMRRLLSSGADGVMLRWMLPGSAVLMLGLSMVVGYGHRQGQVQTGEGAAIMLFGGMVLLFVLCFIAAKAVARQQTSARLAEEALREREETFRALADNISQLAWMADETGALVWYNQRWFDYTGTRPETMLGWGWRAVHHPDHLQRVEDKFRRCLADGTAWEDTFPLRGADGSFRWFLSRARPIRDAKTGRVLRWFGTNTDITEQQELTSQLEAARDEAEQANKAKDHFLAALSHELRTPLTPVLMSAAALREDERLPQEVREEAAMMERNIGLESRLIDDLLDLTRITHGKLGLRKELCDVHALARYAMEIIRDEAQAKGVKLSLRFGASRSGVDADPARLQQVFWNLLRNALKFTPAKGSITLTTHDAPDGSLVLEVRDTGIGFEADVAERLFLPFHQAGRETYHQYGGGLGLGLSIAKAIVDAHGGSLQGSSPGSGKGATFVITLPDACDPPTSRFLSSLNGTTDQPVPAKAPSKGARVLLVEDHEPTLLVLQKLLVRNGHDVTTASSVAAGIEAAEKGGNFEVLVSDLGLPDGTGLELMAQLRDRDAGLRGIALSGYGMESDLIRSREAGFQKHLVKPVNLQQLLQAVDAIVAKPEDPPSTAGPPAAP
jgi:PAS domain S-box-containing protein